MRALKFIIIFIFLSKNTALAVDAFCVKEMQNGMLALFSSAKTKFKLIGGGDFPTNELYPKECHENPDVKLVYGVDAEARALPKVIQDAQKEQFQKDMIKASFLAHYLSQYEEISFQCHQVPGGQGEKLVGIRAFEPGGNVPKKNLDQCLRLKKYFETVDTPPADYCQDDRQHSFTSLEAQIHTLLNETDQLKENNAQARIFEYFNSLQSSYPVLFESVGFFDGRKHPLSSLQNYIQRYAQKNFSLPADFSKQSPDEVRSWVDTNWEKIYIKIKEDPTFQKELSRSFVEKTASVDAEMVNLCLGKGLAQYWLHPPFVEGILTSKNKAEVTACVKHYEKMEKIKTGAMIGTGAVVIASSAVTLGAPLIFSSSAGLTLLSSGAALTGMTAGTVGTLLGVVQLNDSFKNMQSIQNQVFAQLRNNGDVVDEKNRFLINAMLTGVDFSGATLLRTKNAYVKYLIQSGKKLDPEEAIRLAHEVGFGEIGKNGQAIGTQTPGILPDGRTNYTLSQLYLKHSLLLLGDIPRPRIQELMDTGVVGVKGKGYTFGGRGKNMNALDTEKVIQDTLGFTPKSDSVFSIATMNAKGEKILNTGTVKQIDEYGGLTITDQSGKDVYLSYKEVRNNLYLHKGVFPGIEYIQIPKGSDVTFVSKSGELHSGTFAGIDEQGKVLIQSPGSPEIQVLDAAELNVNHTRFGFQPKELAAFSTQDIVHVTLKNGKKYTGRFDEFIQNGSVGFLSQADGASNAVRNKSLLYQAPKNPKSFRLSDIDWEKTTLAP